MADRKSIETLDGAEVHDFDELVELARRDGWTLEVPSRDLEHRARMLDAKLTDAGRVKSPEFEVEVSHELERDLVHATASIGKLRPGVMRKYVERFFRWGRRNG